MKSKAMNQLEAALKTAQDEARAIMAKPDVTAKDIIDKTTEIQTIKAKIEAQAALDDGKKFDASGEEIKDVKPVNEPVYAEARTPEKALHLFGNFSEQLKAVRNAAINGAVDERLARLNAQNAAAGANEGNPDEGGYAVQSDFAGTMMETAASAGQILPKVDQYQISGSANRVAWTDMDESDISSTVYGGVRVYWAAEAEQVTATKPKLTERELKLQKLMGIAYATYELESDSNFTSQLYSRAFALAIQREFEGTIISGNGAGKPLGYLNGGALVSVAKESGQAADTVVWENIVKMYNRALNPANPNYVWLVHPDVSEQFDYLNFPIGTGGVPVYLPAAQQGAVTTLKSHPVIASDHCSALGDLGDINYVDLSQYMMIYKGGVQADTSMHVQFLTAENCFRFIFRANGMPKRNKALTIKNSSNTRSPFITLAARA
jgi:HK97 family phage major capsid protein